MDNIFCLLESILVAPTQVSVSLRIPLGGAFPNTASEMTSILITKLKEYF